MLERERGRVREKERERDRERERERERERGKFSEESHLVNDLCRGRRNQRRQKKEFSVKKNAKQFKNETISG